MDITIQKGRGLPDSSTSVGDDSLWSQVQKLRPKPEAAERPECESPSLSFAGVLLDRRQMDRMECSGSVCVIFVIFHGMLKYSLT